MQPVRYPGSVYRSVRTISIALCGLCLLAAIIVGGGIVGWQAYQWAAYGHWTRLSLFDAVTWAGMATPHTDWVGIQHAIYWLLDQPVAGSVVCLLVVLAFIPLLVAAWAEDQDRKNERIWREDNWRKTQAK